MKGYPITLTKLEHMRCVVVGGGSVAERKVGGLCEAQAHVVVISPDLTEQLQAWAGDGTLIHYARRYAPGDLHGARLAIAATNQRSVNAAVAAEANALGILLNVADDPAAGNFHTSAALRRGDVTLAISTGAASPALAALIRRQLETTIGPEYAALSAWLAQLRQTDAVQLAPAARTRLYRALASEQVLAWLRAGDVDRLHAFTAQLLAELAP